VFIACEFLVVRYDSSFARSSGANTAGSPVSRSVDVSDWLDMACATKMSRLFQGASGGSVTMSQVLRLGASNFYELAYLFWGGGLVSDWWLKLDNHHKLEVNQDTYISQHRSKKSNSISGSRVVCSAPRDKQPGNVNRPWKRTHINKKISSCHERLQSDVRPTAGKARC
jgi:hypothetical protein